MVSRQARWSDWGKRARRTVPGRWGGRFADGRDDALKPWSFFGYVGKHRSGTVVGKSILKYPVVSRRKWKSYGVKYRK